MLRLRNGFEAASISHPAAQGAIEQLEGLQRLTQIVTRCGEKAALALVGPIRELASLFGQCPGSFGSLTCHDEFRLDVLSIGDIAYGGDDESSRHILDGAQTDFDRELSAVAPPSKKHQARSHGAYPHIIDVVLAMSDVPGVKALRHQHFDALADDIVMLVTEQRRNLPIGKADDAAGVDDDHRVRGSVERAACKIRRDRTHSIDL